MSVVGTRIKERRLALGLSQEALADLASTSQKQVSRYESGHNDPTGDVIIAFAQVLHTSSDYLLGITDDPKPPTGNNDLDTTERKIIAAWRRGDRAEAARIILNG